LAKHARAKAVSKAVYEAQAAFRFALRRFYRVSETNARRLGLTPQQYQALLAVWGYPGRDRVTVGELAERLQLRPHSAVGLAGRLVGKGLATKETSSLDRRRVFLQLTPRGRDLVRRVSASNRDELRRAGPELIQLLRRLMKR